MRPVNPSSSDDRPAPPLQTARPESGVGSELGSWLGAVLVGLFVAVLVLVLHRSALDAGFVFDDRVRILEAESRIDTIWPAEWARGTQRPLVGFTLALNHALGGFDPWGWHALNLGVHATSSVLVVLVVVAGGRRLRGRGLLARSDPMLVLIGAAIALLWALHPVQTATATYVIQRAESLAALWSLVAVLGLLLGADTSRARGWTSVVVGSVVLAVASKPTAVVLPALLLAVDWFVLTGSLAESWRRRWPLHAAAVIATAMVLVATGALTGLIGRDGHRSGAGFGVVEVGPFEYAISQVRAIGLYARIGVDPSAMRIDHGSTALAANWTHQVGMLVLAAVAVAIALGLRRGAWWTILPVAAVLVLLPTTSVVPLVDAVADHRLHLTLLPVMIALVAGAVGIAGIVARRSSGAEVVWWMFSILALAVSLVAGARGIADRNLDYAEPARLWSEVLESDPQHVKALVNRAAAALEAGRDDDAARDLAAAADLEPGNPALLVNLAILDVRRGRPESALERLAVASRTRGDDPALLAARGDALRAVGRPSEAVESYREAILRQPGDPYLRLAMGNALSDAARFDEAAEAFAIAASVAEDPRLVASARFNEGNMRYRQDRLEEAIVAYEAALAADPDHAGAGRWLAEARRDRDAGG